MANTHIAKKYSAVGLGGTFDHFHVGHASFLEHASTLSEMLIIGITTEAMLKHKPFSTSIEAYEDRKAAVTAFLHAKKIPHEIVPLHDVAGPALTDTRIEALIVTSDTIKGAEKINELRSKAGVPPLPVEVAEMVAGNGTTTVSSGRIRAGTHNRAGQRYSQLFNKKITLTQEQRSSMRIVHGTLRDSAAVEDSSRFLVGDSTLKRFLKHAYAYDMAVIDGKEQREPYYPLAIDHTAIDLIVANPPGAITPMLAKGIEVALRQKLIHIYVDGEEDLAAVVLLLLLPLGAVIYYGQPSEGLVRWEVTEEMKEHLATLLNPHFQTNPKLVE